MAFCKNSKLQLFVCKKENNWMSGMDKCCPHCGVFIIMDGLQSWHEMFSNAILLLGGPCELIACPVCNLFISFLFIAEIMMVVTMPKMITVMDWGAWFYSQPLLQTVCFTKEFYRVSLRLNMIYTNLYQSFLCNFPHEFEFCFRCFYYFIQIIGSCIEKLAFFWLA